VSDAETLTCFHHKGRETGRCCTRCGRPACSDCLHQAAVGSQCFECVRAARPPTRERVRRWNATAGPLVTKVLLGINVAVYVLTAFVDVGGRGNELEFRLAVFAPAVADGEIYRVLTSGFLHFNLLHLGFNMALLYRLGESLEATLGRTRFVLLYFAALLTGSLGALVLSPNAATGGASGAVFGLMGAVAVGQHLRGTSVWEGGIGALIAINLVISFAVPGISIGGHLGGLAGGAVVGFVMLRPTSSPRANAEGIGAGVAVIVLAVLGCVLIASGTA